VCFEQSAFGALPFAAQVGKSVHRTDFDFASLPNNSDLADADWVADDGCDFAGSVYRDELNVNLIAIPQPARDLAIEHG